MTTPVAINPERMRDEGDCALAALAMLTGAPYPTVSRVALKTVRRRPHATGLWAGEVMKIAKALKTPLRRLKLRGKLPSTLDDEATGILLVQRGDGSHAVVLFQGVVINPADGLIWDLDTYLTEGEWTPHELLVPIR